MRVCDEVKGQDGNNSLAPNIMLLPVLKDFAQPSERGRCRAFL